MSQHSIFSLGAAALMGVALLFSACKMRETEHPLPAPRDPDIFTASIGTESEVFMEQGCHLFWNADDRISVFTKTVENREFRFLGADGDKEGSFEETAEPGAAAAVSAFYAASPYKADNAISQAGVLSLTLPATQVYRPDSMDPGAQLMVASSQDHSFQFQNVGCAFGFQLKGSNVQLSSITLRGNADEPLAGRMEITIGEELQHAFVQEQTSTSITLNIPEPVSLDAQDPTVFWMVVPPVSFSNGITITVTTPDGKICTQTTEQPLTLSRGDATRMAPLAVHPVAPGAPGQLGIYPQYHGNGSSVPCTPASMETSVFELDGKLWTRFLEMGRLRMYQLGPIPAQVAPGDSIDCVLTVTLAGKEESTQDLTLQVLSLSGGILSLTDGNDNYYIVRI